ncbi:MAG: cell division protein FtsL [Hyphomicrobium sp.]
MRLHIFAALAIALTSAFALYGINYDTRQLERRVQAKERAIKIARRDIAVLKAERAHLGRPERIEPLARAQGLRPATERQLFAGPAEAMANVFSETAQRTARASRRE